MANHNAVLTKVGLAKYDENPFRKMRERMEDRLGRAISWREIAETIAVHPRWLAALCGAHGGRYTQNIVEIFRISDITDGALDVRECYEWAAKQKRLQARRRAKAAAA